jgi:mono/diheme cytochrome c family protein
MANRKGKEMKPVQPIKPLTSLIVAAAIVFVLLAAVIANADDFIRSTACVQHRAAVVQYAAPVKKIVAVQHHANVYNHHAYDDYQYKYYVGQGLRDQAIVEKTADRVLQLLQDRLELNAPPAASPAASTSGSKLEVMQEIATRSCVRCHNPAKEDRLDLSDVSRLSELQALEAMRRVYSGNMPQGGPPLSDKEVAAFVDAVVEWQK